QTRAQLDAIEKNPQRMKMMQDAVDRTNAQRRQEYAKEVETFEREHPTDPKQAIVRRLKQFVETCGTVDFGAKLNASGRFVNPAYEKQSQDWKLCYRAGREPVDAGVTFARAWLKELGS
ncbi:MAG TPA: hypothetical protein VFX12_16140, partial [Vicinamibacterales bacterium]|nr:hypothetical protein [Vicinamibacterales bacterium]